MATKKLAEDIEEIKKSLSFMSQEITNEATEQKGLKLLLEEIKQLKILVQEKDKKTEQLERRTDDLEQYSRMLCYFHTLCYSLILKWKNIFLYSKFYTQHLIRTMLENQFFLQIDWKY